jgi:superoxide dismutase, Fe-Mn family
MTNTIALQPLNYNFNDLEPYLDAKTLEIHHTKHHQTYLDNLNKLISENKELENLELEDILLKINQLPIEIQTPTLNNAGQVYNHNKYFECLSPIIDQNPSQELLAKICQDFGSMEIFKDNFKKAGLSQFGSGWVFLIINDKKELEIVKASNAGNPITNGVAPILTMDVWEHAYYLKYQNKRADYIDNFFRIINWELVSQNYSKQL